MKSLSAPTHAMEALVLPMNARAEIKDIILKVMGAAMFLSLHILLTKVVVVMMATKVLLGAINSWTVV